MLPKQRVYNAMKGIMPDRVPVMCQLSIGHQLINSGVAPSELWFSADGFAEALLKTREIYGFDGVLVNLTHNSDLKNRIYDIRRTYDCEIVYFKNGDKAVCPYRDNMHWIFEKEGEKLTIENIIPEKIAIQFPTPEDTLTTRLLSKKIGCSYSIHGEVSSPFTYLFVTLGIEQALMALLDEPDKCKAVIERFVKLSATHAAAHLECGADAIVISSPYAGQGFISKTMYWEFELPYIKCLVSEIHNCKPGVPVYIHTCGSLDDRLEDMTESGVDGIECLDPAPLGNVRLEDAKKRIGNKVFIKGNIDSVNTLLWKDEKGVTEDVMHCLEVGKPGGKYILSTACSVAPDVPPHKIKLMVQLAEEYGTYPVSI